MSLLFRRLNSAVSGCLRRPLSTAVSRPPWAMVYVDPVMDTAGAPVPGARASLDLNEAPWASYLSVPAHLVNPDGATADFLTGRVRASTGDGLLLLDFIDNRQYAPFLPPDSKVRFSWFQEMGAIRRGIFPEPEITRFVCNPLSGQLSRLPDMDRTEGGMGFGLLTQSGGGRGPPDRYVVAEVFRGNCGGEEIRVVVRRFLSDTGEWEEMQLAVPSPELAGRTMHVYHEVLAFRDRLWWVDVSWGACSVDPFSDRPEFRFVELPRGSVVPDLDGMAGKRCLDRYRRMGVSEGKLRYVEVANNKKPFVVSSYTLDEEGGC